MSSCISETIGPRTSPPSGQSSLRFEIPNEPEYYVQTDQASTRSRMYHLIHAPADGGPANTAAYVSAYPISGNRFMLQAQRQTAEIQVAADAKGNVSDTAIGEAVAQAMSQFIRAMRRETRRG